ncbi:MAG: hypothetical protein U0X73_14760 [Thermoanaerobaculia bacterium]
MDADRDQLLILSVFHYLMAAFVVLLSLVPSILLFVAMQTADPEQAQSAAGGAPAASTGAMFALVSLALVGGVLLASLLVAAARCLAATRRRRLCLTAAILVSFVPPFGTVVGLATLVVLMRPSVQQLFAQPAV